jgi:hypothetical protein
MEHPVLPGRLYLMGRATGTIVNGCIVCGLMGPNNVNRGDFFDPGFAIHNR